MNRMFSVDEGAGRDPRLAEAGTSDHAGKLLIEPVSMTEGDGRGLSLRLDHSIPYQSGHFLNQA